MIPRWAAWLLVCATIPNLVAAEQPTPAWDKLAATSCVACHGERKQRGKVRLDLVRPQIVDEHSYGLWSAVVEQLASAAMPPDEAESKPPRAQIEQALAELRPLVTAARAAGFLHPERAPIRRLTRDQYRNSLRDLLGIDVACDDPARELPDDRRQHGFDTVGDQLVLSDSVMAGYLTAATRALALAAQPVDPAARTTRRYISETNRFRLEGGIPGPVIGHEIYRYYDLIRGYWSSPQENGHLRTIGENPFPRGGIYRLSLAVESLGRQQNELTSKIRNYSSARPHQLAIRLCSPIGIHPEIERTVAIHDVPDGRRIQLEHQVYVPRDWRLVLCFDNGPAVPLWVLHEDLIGWTEERAAPGASAEEALAVRKRNAASRPTRAQNIAYLSEVLTPRIRIHELVIDGPLASASPSPFQQQVLAPSDHQQALAAFAQRAFRRPVTTAELMPFVTLAQQRGRQCALTAMLCAPQFLLIQEADGVLDDHALATRLAFALTVSPPDDELRAVADAGRLHEDGVYRAQIERLLRGATGEEAVAHFVTQWLNLANIDRMPPDERRFPKFYQIAHGYHGVRDAVMSEPIRMVRYLIEQNLSARRLIDADFTFVNDALADYYGLAGVDGSTWRQVTLPLHLQRGGILGMAAVLTASANGVDTSPVVRGIYVLDRLLGKTPDPPPAGVPSAEVDLRGTTTIRTILERHRAQPECQSCHRDIDPLGFALESYDAVGHWRSRYANGATIDTAGVLPDGTAFADASDLRRVLASRVQQVAENFLRRFLMFAAGRTLGPLDQPEVRRLVNLAQANDYRMRDMIIAVMQSDIVRRR